MGVPASASAGAYRVEALATVGDRRYQQTLQTIAYPHIQTHRLYAPAVANVRVVKLVVPSVRVGYVLGTGDDVAGAIKLMGIPVTMLDSEALTSGDLSRFDTIVIGVRASEARPDFVANHKRLLQWVEHGGALIVQYQAPDYADRRLPPFPALRSVLPAGEGRAVATGAASGRGRASRRARTSLGGEAEPEVRVADRRAGLVREAGGVVRAPLGEHAHLHALAGVALVDDVAIGVDRATEPRRVALAAGLAHAHQGASPVYA